MNFKRWKYIGAFWVIVFELLALVTMPTDFHHYLNQYQTFIVVLSLIIAACGFTMTIEAVEFFVNRKTKKQESNALTQTILADASICQDVKQEVVGVQPPDKPTATVFMQEVLDDPKVKAEIARFEPFKHVTQEDLETKLD